MLEARAWPFIAQPTDDLGLLTIEVLTLNRANRPDYQGFALGNSRVVHTPGMQQRLPRQPGHPSAVQVFSYSIKPAHDSQGCCVLLSSGGRGGVPPPGRLLAYDVWIRRQNIFLRGHRGQLNQGHNMQIVLLQPRLPPMRGHGLPVHELAARVCRCGARHRWKVF